MKKVSDSSFFCGCSAVTLEQILAAREKRASRIQTLTAEYLQSIISFKMNIPGEIKQYSLARRAFNKGIECIERQLKRLNIAVTHFESLNESTGSEAFFVVDKDALFIKKQMIIIEDNHPLGRLFDIDVTDAKGQNMSGNAVGRLERTCLICGGPVWVCARSRRHTADELAFQTAKTIEGHLFAGFADKTASFAVRALLYEVGVTPKPGLVDRCGNGAHSDMDFFTFMDSTAALSTYFRDITLKALHSQTKPGKLLGELRYLGQTAENTMFAATNGVNTHKGIIFSLGLLCAAAGALYHRDLPVTPVKVLDTAAQIAAELPGELKKSDEEITYGKQAYDAHCLLGARGEAAAGFPSVRFFGYPLLKELIQEKALSMNDAGVITLLGIMAQLDDTNMVHRKGIASLKSLQQELQAFQRQKRNPDEMLNLAQELDETLVLENLSPGGSADMLALSFFLYFVDSSDFYS